MLAQDSPSKGIDAIRDVAPRKISMPIAGSERVARLWPRNVSRRPAPAQRSLAAGRGATKIPSSESPAPIVSDSLEIGGYFWAQSEAPVQAHGPLPRPSQYSRSWLG